MQASGLALILLLAAPVASAQAPAPNESKAILADVGAEVMASVARTNPLYLLQKGLAVESLPDFSTAGAQERAAQATALLARLERVDEAGLDHEDRLSLLVLRRQLGETRAEPGRRAWRFQITPYSSPLGLLSRVFAGVPLATADDRARYLKLLDDVPRVVAQVGVGLDEQEAIAVRAPRPALPAIVALHRSFAAPSATSPFRVEPSRLPELPPAERDAFLAAVAERIDGRIVPALAALADRIAGPYSEKAPEGVGLAQYAGGRAVYDALVKSCTTMDVTAERVHEIGLRHVARIDAEMAAIRRELGFTGTAAEFKESLKANPRFFPKTPEEIGERFLQHVARIEPAVDRYFLRRPKAPYGVRRLDPRLEPGQTFGYYQIPSAADPRGYYRYNGSNLADRSLLNAAALIFHELVPGHHFQINLTHENTALPEFRRELSETAYSEGWGEYAAGLAGEMGMYSDPYDRYGRLAMEMFVSMRLVVDTGMNAFGWSRERATAFMREHGTETDTQIASETLRYATDMPGQALAYKMGAEAILDLREKARRELGPGFDVRRFHDWILGSGALPIAVLERHVEAFIAREKR